MSQGYTKAKLYQIGKDNYNTLAKYCDLLLQEGYWEKPEAVLRRPIEEMLDLYLQALLVQLAVFCGCFNPDERQFIADIPEHNMLGLTSVLENDTVLVYQAEKVLHAPPILLQLCSLRDIEKSSCIGGMFFDTLLNILLTMSYINDSKNTKLTSFILGYYHQVSAFLKGNDKLNYIIDERYVFRKISCEELEYSNALQLTSNGDFEKYKDKYILNRDKAKINIRKIQNKAVDSVIEKEKFENKPAEVHVQNDLSYHTAAETISRTESETGDERKEKLEEYLEELYSLIGLDSVKTEINSLINLIKVRKLREEYNMPMMDMSFHMVYTGNPGTGKTTVARLVAKIYKELGILSEGNMIETDRSGLVAGYVGQTALKVKEVVERALGGVLFIDEAYSLAGSIGSNDFGAEAIDTLVKMMEDHRDNLVVIVAGYRDEMQKFLKANTGLISRFNKFIDFADYTNEELILILKAMAGKAGLVIEEETLIEVKNKLDTMDKRNRMQFGNARGIRNVFEKIVVNQANRLVTYDRPTKEQLSEVLPEDIYNVL
ncbi:AAA family ATPase [Anaerocolumna sedimenticola]|uniref:AAA family ATPase n=1 Tax=Anaerocolumna sedimenticola TaxID=2696063 RepID=A0A6P1TMR8_9FIRM|nr:AAA family ATPase [Anaerocolumna sedimenticola]QHQ62510.1 AAA family ATPase [Anaerocolumna sedimenticola]